MSLGSLQGRDSFLFCTSAVPGPTGFGQKEQQWWLVCHCKHLCGIINTSLELKTSHPDVRQGDINPVPAEVSYMPAPSLFPSGYLFPLCPFSSFNVSPSSSTTRRGHKQITGEWDEVRGRQREPRSEVLHPRALWKILFVSIRDKKHFCHIEMSAFQSFFFPRKALWLGSSWTDYRS